MLTIYINLIATLIILLCSQTALATAYTYLGTFNYGGTLNGGDTLTMVNSTPTASSSFATGFGAGNIQILNSGSPHSINVSKIGSSVSILGSANNGDFIFGTDLTINASLNGNGLLSGLYSGSAGNTAANTIHNYGSIMLTGPALVIYGINCDDFTKSVYNHSSGIINIANTGIRNSAGIYMDASVGNTPNITNDGTITVTNPDNSAFGILCLFGEGSNIINTGTISVNDSYSNGYGIYTATNSPTTITNTGGTITGSRYSVYDNNATTSLFLQGGILNGDILGINNLTADLAVTTINGNTSTNQFINNLDGTIILNGSLTCATSFTNSGTTIVQQGFNQSNLGTFTNTGIISFDGNSSSLTNNLTGAGTGSIEFGNTTPTTNFSLASVISSFPNIKINTGSIVTLATGGAISGTTLLTIDGALVNNSVLNIGSGITLAGAGSITNNASASLTIQNGATLSNSITNNGTTSINGTVSINQFINNLGGTAILNGSLTCATSFTNSGTTIVQQGFNQSNLGTFTNTGIISFDGNSSSLTNNLTGAGTGSIEFGNITPTTNFSLASVISSFPNIKINTGSIVTLATGGAISGTTLLTIDGALVNNSVLNIGSGITLAGAGSITNNASASLTIQNGATLSNSITNNGTTSINGTVSINQFINNLGGTAILNGSLTCATSFTNSGTTIVQQGFNQSNLGTFTNTGIISFDGNSSSLTNNLTGAGTGSIEFGNITPTTNFSLASVISSFPNIKINTGSIVTLATGGAISGTTLLTIDGALVNNSVLNIGSGITLAGAGSITNNASASLTIQNGATLSNSITNNGTTSINGTVSINNTFTNNNLLDVSNVLTMTGQLLDSNGTVTLSSSATVNAGSYNANIHNITITDDTAYGKIITSGASNLTGATINVTSSYASNAQWPIIIAGSGMLSGSPTVNLPSSSKMFNQWSYWIDSNTSLIVSLQAASIALLADGTVNIEIAEVIENMANNITNAGQQILVDAIYASTTEEQLNHNLQLLRPNTNANTPIIATQGAIFNKIEHRIASLNNNVHTTGIMAGDINPTTAIWFGGFGSFAKQKEHGENLGYKSKIFGGIFGLDTIINTNCVIGFGLGYSKNIVNEYIAPNFNTNVTGYHLLAYGSTAIQTGLSLEWLASGAYANNNGSRKVIISNVVMSTTSNYHSLQGAGRINLVADYELIAPLILSPLATVQYSAEYQPNYDEAYSPAALHISPSNYQNVLTVGTGIRLSFCDDEWWAFGAREIRILGTYDVVTSKNNIVSNFLVGSSTFDITNPATSRFAFKTGIDLNIPIFKHLHLQLSYDYELRIRYNDQSGSAKIKFVF